MPSARVTVVKGCELNGPRQTQLNAEVRAARTADVTVLAIGKAADMNGEAASRWSLDLPGPQPIDPSALAVRRDDGSSSVVPGTFTVWAGTSSVGGLETSIEVK